MDSMDEIGINSMDGLGAGISAPIFADGEITFHGQPIGLIVADTLR
jgi:xanthine dehydrogenase molybdopterin-binding subunit B